MPTTDGEAIEPFALRVAEAWKIGRKKIDDGALLVIAKNDRRLRIEVGYGLEGPENRITVASNRYIKAVQDYNVGIRTFPNNLTAMAFGYKEKPNFTVENEKEISTAPKVDFNPTPAPAK